MRQNFKPCLETGMCAATNRHTAPYCFPIGNVLQQYQTCFQEEIIMMNTLYADWKEAGLPVAKQTSEKE
jgi:hypothetical protein